MHAAFFIKRGGFLFFRQRVAGKRERSFPAGAISMQLLFMTDHPTAAQRQVTALLQPAGKGVGIAQKVGNRRETVG
ncbi:hypothetical protein BIY27_01425 [Gibbsiella quercinecans]|nr:hypothetical protein BIY27_01425 [Gibbsiella quercinecans]